MTRRSRAREVALQLLFQNDFNSSAGRGAVEQLALDRLRDADLKAFCLSLYDGVLAHREDIDRRLTEAAENWRLPRMAAVHGRRPDKAWVGTVIDKPAIDFAKLAQAQGVWAEGPVEDPAKLGAALKRAVAIVKSGEPALVDVVCQGR